MTKAYIAVGTYFEQFNEFIVLTTEEELDEIIKKCKEDIDKSHSISFDKNGKSFVGLISGLNRVKGQRDHMVKCITRYTPFMINYMREHNDKRYGEWNADISLYVCYNSVIKDIDIRLIDPSTIKDDDIDLIDP